MPAAVVLVSWGIPLSAATVSTSAAEPVDALWVTRMAASSMLGIALACIASAALPLAVRAAEEARRRLADSHTAHAQALEFIAAELRGAPVSSDGFGGDAEPPPQELEGPGSPLLLSPGAPDPSAVAAHAIVLVMTHDVLHGQLQPPGWAY